VIGYYRPDRMQFLGRVGFYSGKISPRQIVISQISRGWLSKSLRQTGAIE
jgi:hypothetical protein